MCVLYFFIDFYFLQVLIFLERRRTVDLVFLIVRFVRVRNAGPYVCGLLNCTRRAMACNWFLVTGMSGGFIRGLILLGLPTESNSIPHWELSRSAVAPPCAFPVTYVANTTRFGVKTQGSSRMR